jgi:hypothetical protein
MNMPKVVKELKEMVERGCQPSVVFKNPIEDFETCLDPGMRPK